MRTKLILILALVLGVLPTDGSKSSSNLPHPPDSVAQAKPRPEPDAIDRLAANLISSMGLWLNGFPNGIVFLPESTAIPKVVSQILTRTNFDSERVTHYRILESRQVNIPEGSMPENYLMVLVKTNLGEKIVATRYSSEEKGWRHRIYDANGPPYLEYY
jgi:hypothetical protein